MLDIKKPKDYNKKRKQNIYYNMNNAGWSSLESRRAHNPKVAGSNPAPAIFLFLSHLYFLRKNPLVDEI